MGEPRANPSMCPNCVTPWKCNGPHIPEDVTPDRPAPQDALREAVAAEIRGMRPYSAVRQRLERALASVPTAPVSEMGRIADSELAAERHVGEPPAPPPLDVERLASALSLVLATHPPAFTERERKRDRADHLHIAGVVAAEYARLGPAEDPQEPPRQDCGCGHARHVGRCTGLTGNYVYDVWCECAGDSR